MTNHAQISLCTTPFISASSKSRFPPFPFPMLFISAFVLFPCLLFIRSAVVCSANVMLGRGCEAVMRCLIYGVCITSSATISASSWCSVAVQFRPFRVAILAWHIFWGGSIKCCFGYVRSSSRSILNIKLCHLFIVYKCVGFAPSNTMSPLARTKQLNQRKS